MAIKYDSKGFPQMELFSVVVHNHGEGSLNLYGSITIFSHHNQSIYKREREDPECFPSYLKSFSLLLDAAPQLIHCGENYTFCVDLKHRVENDDASFDEELCKGTISMEFDYDNEMKLNELLKFRLDQKECSVEFGFGFYETAAIAHVAATLINLKMEDVKVYGQITSQTSLIRNASKTLLNKKRKDSIMVQQHDESVVLQQPGSLVVAPLDSELTICANLYVCRDDHASRLLAGGTANFLVKEFGTSVGVFLVLAVIFKWTLIGSTSKLRLTTM